MRRFIGFILITSFGFIQATHASYSLYVKQTINKEGMIYFYSCFDSVVQIKGSLEHSESCKLAFEQGEGIDARDLDLNMSPDLNRMISIGIGSTAAGTGFSVKKFKPFRYVLIAVFAITATTEAIKAFQNGGISETSLVLLNSINPMDHWDRAEFEDNILSRNLSPKDPIIHRAETRAELRKIIRRLEYTFGKDERGSSLGIFSALGNLFKETFEVFSFGNPDPSDSDVDDVDLNPSSLP